MNLPTTTTQILREDIAGASSFLRYLNVKSAGEHQGFGDAFTQVRFSTDATMLNYGRALAYVTKHTETVGWLEQFIELLVQSQAQPLTTQIYGRHRQGQTHGENQQWQRISWKKLIAEATKQEEIVAILRLFGLDAIADRLGYLQRTIADDPDEQPLTFESLRGLALFLMSERQLPYPQIAISPEGNAQIEWRVGEYGILAMEFLPVDGLIRFAAISAPAKLEVQRNKVYGTLPKEDALNAVKAFTSEISTQ